MDKLEILDKIWMMVENKAVELMITEITATQKIVKGENDNKDSITTTYEIYASWSILYTRDVQVKERMFFETKQDLIQSL